MTEERYPLAPFASDALDTYNRWCVTGHHGRVVMMMPPQPGQLLTPAEAFQLAAWLFLGIELAEPAAVTELGEHLGQGAGHAEFQRFVERLRNT